MRIRKLSANEKIFQESSKIYTDALKNNALKEEFTYLEENIANDINKEKNKKYDHKNRKRKIIWFTPPLFCRLASINIGKYFFETDR